MTDQPGTEARRRLLRQLAAGFSVYRLYPGSLEVQTFVAAAERIHAAAAVALETGPVHVELRAGRFVLDGEPVHEDALRSLAQACFARRLQHLRVDQPPSTQDLGSLFAAVTAEDTAVEEAGGVAGLLERDGVTSIRVAAGAPEPTRGDEVPEHLLDLAGWVDTPEEAPDVTLDLPVEARTDGTALYARLSELSDALPDQAMTRSAFFEQAAERVAALSAGERARFGRLVLDQLTTSTFAERYAGHLPDPYLAELIATTALHEGADPTAIAHDVVVAADRHATLGELVASLAASSVPAGTVTSPRVGAPDADQLTMDHLLRAEFPDTDEEDRELARTALLDYLLLDPGGERLNLVLEAITAQLRDDVRAADAAAVRALLDVLDRAAAALPDAVARELHAPRRAALDAEVLQELATSHEGRIDPALLAPFGEQAVDAAVDVLSATHDQERHRRALRRILGGLAGEHLDRIGQHLGRRRPAVVATLVEVLAHDPRDEVLSLLERLAHHPDRLVLAAVVDALAERDPVAAAPIVGRVATRSEDREVQLRCLDVLAGYAGPAGSEVLARLGRRGPPPRLGWRLRRRARALARRGGGSA